MDRDEEVTNVGLTIDNMFRNNGENNIPEVIVLTHQFWEVAVSNKKLRINRRNNNLPFHL